MKRYLFLLVLFVSPEILATDTRFEMQIGFPNLLQLRADRPITPSWRLGLAFGAFPFGVADLVYKPQINAEVSDDYDLILDPSLRAIATGLYAEWSRPDSRHFARLELMLNIFGVTAKTFLMNRSSSAKAPYSELDAAAILPRLTATYGIRAYQGENWKLLAGAGVTLLLAKQIVVTTSGPGPAYFEAVPSAKSSVDDGMQNLENELTSILSNSAFSAVILPAIWFSLLW
jgi:hypothetical protein